MTTSCSKNSVDEFMSIVSDGKLDSLYSEMKFDIMHCYNVTPESIVVYDTSTMDNPSVGLFVAAVSPSLSSKIQ